MRHQPIAPTRLGGNLPNIGNHKISPASMGILRYDAVIDDATDFLTFPFTRAAHRF